MTHSFYPGETRATAYREQLRQAEEQMRERAAMQNAANPASAKWADLVAECEAVDKPEPHGLTLVRDMGRGSGWTIRLQNGGISITGGSYDDAHGPVMLKAGELAAFNRDLDAVVSLAGAPK